MGIIVIIILAIVAYCIIKAFTNSSREDSSGTVPAKLSIIHSFIHGYCSLCSQHSIDSTGILITHKKVNNGYEIAAYTKIFKIDGSDAAESVESLRLSIANAKRNIELKNKHLDPVELFKLKSGAADDIILSYFGTDSLTGSFWDIDDCEYVDGRYLEFEAIDKVFDSFNESFKKSIEALITNIRDNYPNAQIDIQKDMLVITIN